MARAAHRDGSSQLVVIGASAGGVDALSALVGTLPADLPAPIVVAQHLDPTRESHLTEILASRSTLPVRTIADREPLEAGVVFVVPANRHINISDGHIEFAPETASRSMPSIDLLFRTAAATYGESLIAVILTGLGSDGAAGAHEVKRAGGTVVIQNPATATYPGMPLSLAPTTVDLVADLERIGPLLRDLLLGIATPSDAAGQQALDQFLADLRERFGVDFRAYKPPTILRRLQRRIVATGSRDLPGYRRYLQAHPEECQVLISTFLIKVTEFFRDSELFDHLRDELLPDLLQHARRRGNELRLWSAGCATGEEAYSLAILVAEALGQALDHYTVRIFATDLDEEAIAFARRGVYASAALADLPEELIGRYFTATDGGYEIKKHVRNLVIFGQHDLAQRAPFPRIDLILCRNVLIYFAPELQRRTLQIFAHSLRNDGYLLLGKAETNAPLAEFFQPQHKVHKVYRRIGERLLLPPGPTPPVSPAPVARLGLMRRLAVDQQIAREGRGEELSRTHGEAALQRLPLGVVVVDRRYDIRTINAVARQLLAIYSAAIGEDLLHTARGLPVREARAAIDQVFRTGQPATLDEFPVEETAASETRFVQLAAHPWRREEKSGHVEEALLIVSDITREVERRRALEERARALEAAGERDRRAAAGEAAQREQLLNRLVETNRQLMEANQSLTVANEELRASSEEFLLSTEEAQAATEEVETLNEELQATNEELETLNEELQATIEKLNTTNDDLHARSAELQELARASEEERGRLQALLNTMGDAVVVVDLAGRVLLTNPAYDRFFGAGGAPFSLEDADGRPLPRAETPQQRVIRGESFSQEFTAIDVEGERRVFEVNGAPSYNASGRQQWGVLVIRDITERSLHRLQDEFLSLASHELRTPLTTLQGYLQMLNRQLAEQPADSRARRYAASAAGQSERLARLVNDLVDVARLQSGKYSLDLRLLRLDEVVGQAVEAARLLAGNRTIAFDRDDAPLPVNGDAGRLEQVVMNLLTNTLTHAPESERIEVRVRRAGDAAEIVVQDYGPGIPAEDLPHLFSRFFQTQARQGSARRGLGLGLFIAREIVVGHGGAIEAASVLGEGTTFTVRLPLLPIPPEAEGDTPEE